MAAILRNAAAAASNKGMPSSFYNKDDKSNPVLQSLDKELKMFYGFIKKKNVKGYRKPDEEAQSRPADTLFEIWNKYEPRLPKSYYQEKLLEVGDFLMTSKEYSLALWQCYDRYLMYFGDVNMEHITDVEIFKSIFFPQGFDGDTAGLTEGMSFATCLMGLGRTLFRALMGKSISMYQVVRVADPKLQNKQSVDSCVQILSFLRLVMQVVLPKETMCWLVYNGTVHIYSISRYLMSLGHSAKVLEYVLWASMCMETSVPLLAVKYLQWRSTLYTAVCQCYFDCKASNHAESFARRGLSKINELSQLETMSSSKDSPEREAAFRQATIKMAIMVFRRTVYETRRRPKGLLRPKTRANLKDALGLQWPRTPSEKLLHDMFEGSATQFLCILESLNDSNRRILLSSPPAPDSEVEILDVYAELFLAGQEILSGGGGHHAALPKPPSTVGVPAMAGVIKGKQLIDLATRGEDGVTVDGAIKLVKFAFCFEQWDVFENLIENVLAYLKVIEDDRYVWDEKCLQILAAMEKVMSSRKHKRTASQNEDEHTHMDHEFAPSVLAQSAKSVNLNDELIQLADILMSVVTGPFTPESIEVDIIVDAALFLWNKCKTVFQKFQTGSVDNVKYLSRMENPTKWVFILDVVHQLLCWCGISSVDPALTAEVVLRLGLVLESSANLDLQEDKDRSSVTPPIKDGKTLMKDSSMSDLGVMADGSQHISRTSMLSSSLLNVNPRNQLLQARDIMELGLQNVSFARQAVALTDGKSISDVSWAKDLNKELFTPEIPAQREAAHGEDSTVSREALGPESVPGSATAVWNTIKDLHLELTLMYHRVCLKLEQMGEDPNSKLPKVSKRQMCSRMQFGSDRSLLDTYLESWEELLTRANKNNLSRALLYMQRALLMGGDGVVTKEQRKYLENAVTCIQKAQVEEKRTYLDNTGITDADVKTGRVPPPPILLSRTDTSMVFRPAPWKPATQEKVAWYRIFARNATGSNVKARLNDYYFAGTGEQVPYHHQELKVAGLKPNEKYVVAIAAYTQDGRLIGDGIGESTRPILANHPLPVLTTWAFLSQISYQVGHYDICRQACDVLWDHFIADVPPTEHVTYQTSAESDFKLTLMRLNHKIVCLSSPVVLRQFLTSIFISVDVNVRDGQLFCDVLCDKGPLYKGQIERLKECEKMLVAVELAGWLNESNLALQGVVQIYGLVAPLIFYKIPSIPVFQVLQRCHAVLQEIPSGLRQKRQASIADSLHHMTACITFHVAKVLRNWGQKSLSNSLNDAGRKLLALESGDVKADTKELDKGTMLDNSMDNAEPGSITLQALKAKTRKPKKSTGFMKEHDADGPMNEELKALEAHMLSLSKQAQSEHELSGSEDPSILHAYIAYLPSRIAYREVVKFKKRARYLEFFVQVAQKALTEGLPEMALEWCDDTENWIARRNEQIIGVRAFLTKQPGGTMTVTGDDPKKFAAAMVEYSKEKRGPVRVGKKSTFTKPLKTSQSLSTLGKPLVPTVICGSHSKLGSRASSRVSNSAPSILGLHDEADEITEEFVSPRAPASKMVQNKPQPPSAPKPKRRQKYKALHVTNNMSEAAKQAQEEAEIKSLEKVGMHLPDLYRGWHRKRRLRKICNDETPWKCQLNILQGLSQFSSFMQKLEKCEKLVGNQDTIMFKTNFLDQEWFTFETAGTLIVGWEGGPLHHANMTEPGERKKETTRFSAITERQESDFSSDDDEQTDIGAHSSRKLDMAGSERPRTTTTGIEIAAALATGAPPPPMFTEPPLVEDTPRTYRSDMSTARLPQPETEKVTLTAQNTLDAINKSFGYFKKAIVLAHRGHYWTLLQNAARGLWNCAHTALLRTYTPTLGEDDNGLLTIDELRSVAWKPFHIAADCVLDMLQILQIDLQAQATRAKAKQKKLGDYFESWMGDVKDEVGGASLMFEGPLDDLGVADTRWIRRLVLRVMEILYYEEKWEKLVDMALRFNALTNDRYAEQVVPLLVQAQRRLTDGLAELGGRPAPQPHYQQLMYKLNSVITAKTYLTQQLELAIDKKQLAPVALGAGIDPLGHGLYTSKDALKNISVPLDITYSLSVLYEAFDKAHYTSRALQHSRKLMVLYLSNQQNTTEGMLSRQPSRVDFIPQTARPQPTMPHDISKEQYLDQSDVQTAPIPRSQIGTVITSYEKTIEMLLAKNQRALAAQAMHESGNLQYHAGNIRAAYKWWAEALDLILDADDGLHTWRDMFRDCDDISSELLKCCGIWGCVLGGILTSNIAQFVLTSDLGLRTECCFLSGYLFKALFRASLPHPTADRDYAMYEVGEGCEVTNLVPGIDILSERYRSDGRQLVAALRWVAEELARGQHNLFVLPLLTLNQYFATFVSRDLQRTVDGRILKCRVLADLGLFTEAFIVLQRLLHGERLPHTGDSSFRQVESKIPAFKFRTDKPITIPANLKLLENVLDKRLSSSLSTLYGPHMTCHLSLVQAHLFVCLAKTVPVLPNIEDVLLQDGETGMRQISVSTMGKGGGVGVGLLSKTLKGSDSGRKVGKASSKTSDGAVQTWLEMECLMPPKPGGNVPKSGHSEKWDSAPKSGHSEKRDSAPKSGRSEKRDNAPKSGHTEKHDSAPKSGRSEKRDSAPKSGHTETHDSAPKSGRSKKRDSAPRSGHSEKRDIACKSGDNSGRQTARDDQSDRPAARKRFTEAKKPVTLEYIKGTLLVIADNMVTTISDVIQENAELEKGGLEGLSAAELELVVLCKLEQSDVAQQKHHAPLAARVVLSALKLLQTSQIFKKRRNVPHPPRPSSLKGHRRLLPVAIRASEPENSQFQFQNFQSRSRLDARLWLSLRSALVHCLMLEIRGMGEVKGSENKVLQELADCRQYCAEGLGESEACGDVEKQAEFLLQAACLNIVEGKSIEHTISLIQEAISLLGRVSHLSVPGGQLKATAIVLCTDLEAIEGTDDSNIFTERTRDQYIDAQTIILKQMQDLGEEIEHHYPEGRLPQYSTPVSPLRNVYLPHCLRLSQIKLRVGHAMARTAAKNIRTGSDLDAVQLWTSALSVLMTALEICRASVTREAGLEAELLLNIGKIQRMLVYLGRYQARSAADTLLQAIKISHATDHNLGLMHQAYMEVALVYLYSSGIAVMKEGSSIDVVGVLDSGDESATDLAAAAKKSRKYKSSYKSPRNKKSKSKDDINEQERERRAAWLAVRCAASVATTQRNWLLLTGDMNVTSQKLSEKAQQEVPDFVALDLVSSYVLGERKKVYKSEIEEELSTMVEAQEVKHVESYDEQVQKSRDAAGDLSWIHFLGYQTILARLCSTQTISASSVKSDDRKEDTAGDLGPDFDLGFISHAQCDTSLNHDVVRSMLFSGTWAPRLSRLHTYLCENLRGYMADCCAIYPPSDLELVTLTREATDLDLTVKSYMDNLTSSEDIEGDAQIQIEFEIVPGVAPLPPGSNPESQKPPSKAVTSPTDNEVSLQWYQPSLEETDPIRPDAIGPDSRVLLLYALNVKSPGAVTTPTKIIWLQMSQLNDLHDRLAVLMQRAEIYLQEHTKKKRDPVAPSPTPSSKAKKSQRLKALSPKLQKDEHLEGLLRQCMDDITNLLGVQADQETSSTATTEQIPFEVSRANVRMLESLFDPSFGATVKGADVVTWFIKQIPQ